MRLNKAEIYHSARTIPALKFEDQQLTSFGGLVVFQNLFNKLDLQKKLAACTEHIKIPRFYKHSTILQCLILHILLGYQKLRDTDFYREDPMVKRLLGIRHYPSVPTISRMLTDMDDQTVENGRGYNRQLILDRINQEKWSRITLDFDGSVLGTKKHAEGTAVGFNKNKKGGRSYYPLFCTIAQSSQVLDYLFRSGNVHDSNGAIEFLIQCVEAIRQQSPDIRIETRMDSAFFSEEMVEILNALGIEYTISVPFERLTALKQIIERRQWWWSLKGGEGKIGYFERKWKPKSWTRRSRFMFIRTEAAKQVKGPLQLDLFVPREYGLEYKVIITNKKISTKKIVKYHEGRGQQENIFSELKTQGKLGYIPTNRKTGNEIYILCNILAHNLCRELQMSTRRPHRATNEARSPFWVFEGLNMLRGKFIQKAARLTFPQGNLTLTLSKNEAVESAIRNYLLA